MYVKNGIEKARSECAFSMGRFVPCAMCNNM